jgi:hypothetical protein
MATNSELTSEARLVELLGRERYDDYFNEAVGGDSIMGVGDISANVDIFDNACAMESIIDELLLEAGDAFEVYEQQQGVASNASTPVHGRTRFAVPKTEEEVVEARKASVPKKTQTDTRYCMRLWDEWKMHRNVTSTKRVPDDITEMSRDELQYWMCRFVLEVRKRDGSLYPANTLHHLCCGVMRHLRQTGWHEIDIFKDPSFAEFRATLDSEMKKTQSLGIGSKKRQAEPLTVEEEELLWQTGQLGDRSPQALVDTMLFMNGVYFALRSGDEHRNLRHNPSQIELVEKPGERAYLQYTEDISKNHPGGLKGRKQSAKVVVHYSNPSRCFVRLYKLYQSK